MLGSIDPRSELVSQVMPMVGEMCILCSSGRCSGEFFAILVSSKFVFPHLPFVVLNRARVKVNTGENRKSAPARDDQERSIL